MSPVHTRHSIGNKFLMLNKGFVGSANMLGTTIIINIVTIGTPINNADQDFFYSL